MDSMKAKRLEFMTIDSVREESRLSIERIQSNEILRVSEKRASENVIVSLGWF